MGKSQHLEKWAENWSTLIQLTQSNFEKHSFFGGGDVVYTVSRTTEN